MRLFCLLFCASGAFADESSLEARLAALEREVASLRVRVAELEAERAALPASPSAPALSALDEALLRASAEGDAQAVPSLLAQGADPNARDQRGLTPLMLAAGDNLPASPDENPAEPVPAEAVAKARKEIVRLLLEAGAAIDATSPSGETALIRASRAGESEAIQALLAGGADPSLESKKGETALSAALHAGRYALAEPLADAAERWRQAHSGTMDSSNE